MKQIYRTVVSAAHDKINEKGVVIEHTLLCSIESLTTKSIYHYNSREKLVQTWIDLVNVILCKEKVNEHTIL